jgi:uncharacterized damage-inducible protein DinB
MIKEGLFGQLAAMKEYFDRSTRALEEADSAYAPKEGMFTAAQLVAHVAQTVEWFVRGAFAAGGFDLDFERADKGIRSVTSLGAARAWLERANAEAKAALAAHSEEEWTDHTAHHRGALSVYTRLLGKVPPMPYMDM